MHNHKSHLSRRLAVLALALVAGTLLLACGSSSSNSTGATTAASAATSSGTSSSGTSTPGTQLPNGRRRGARLAALRECLKKAGIALPTRQPGTRPNGTPGNGGDFLKLPKGESQTKFEAAIQKCGGSAAHFGSRARFGGAAFKASLVKFAACMRQHGVNLPAPNTKGNGPLFDTKGIDTTSSAFVTARSRCESLLARDAAPGAGEPPGTGGAPAG
jgi:hypothetical protein